MCDFACMMIGKLVRKPTREFINDAIFQAAKLEIDLLLHTFYVDDLIKRETSEILQMVDAQTKHLKAKVRVLQRDDQRPPQLVVTEALSLLSDFSSSVP